MNTKRKRAILLIIAVLLFVALVGGFVFADDGLYPDIDEAAQNSGDENFIENRDNYYLDSEKMGMLDGVSAMFAGAANALLSFQKDLASMQITIFDLAMKSNVIDLLDAFVVPFIESMRVYIFDEFSLYFISICGLLLLIRLAANRQTQALTGLIQALMIIVIALLFFNNPVLLIEKADEVTQSVSDTVLEAPYNAIYGEGASEDMDGKVAALVWNVMVHKPWQIAEFGSIQTAKEYESGILKYKPDSNERKALVKLLAKDEGIFSKSTHYQISRVTTLFFVGILNLVIFLCLTFFCGMVAMYRMVILVFMLLGVIVFLIALIPVFGVELVRRWVGKILAACSMKILLSFLLAMILVFMDAVYSLIDTKGLIYTMFTIIVIIAAIYTKRNDITSLFSGFKTAKKTYSDVWDSGQRTWRAAGQAWNVGHEMSNRMNNTYMRGNGRSQTVPHWNLGRDNGSQTEPIITPRYESGTALVPSKGAGYVMQPAHSMNFGPAGAGSEYVSSGGGSSYKKEEPVAVKNGTADMKDAAETLKIAAKDMNRYYRKAEQLLQQQYDKSRTTSDEKAKRKGETPRYGEFVRRTDAVRSLGAGKFDQRDIATTARILQRVEKSGGDVDRILVGSGKDVFHEVKRPESLTKRNVSSGGKVSEPSGAVKMRGEGIRGLDYFKANFGEEKGEEFFSDMRKKYGVATVEHFGSSDKLTYAQVQRRIREARGTAEDHAKTQRKKAPEAVNMRKAGNEHGKEE